MTTTRRTITFSFLFYLGLTLSAQTATNKIIDTIHSSILKEDRFAWVHLPNSAVGKSYSKTTYPVVYVLDAEANFESILEILNRLSKRTGSSVYSETIVIGVGNIWERDRDYTPTHVSSSPFVDKMAADKSGGGENFTMFLEKELIPYINSKYPASSSRILIGHSLGGLIAMNILLHHTKLFNAYAAIDPSMWWDDQKLLKQSKSILAARKFDNVSLFLAIANTTNKEMEDVSEIKKDMSSKTALIRPGVALAEQLSANKQNNLKFNWKYYKNEHHMSVYSPAASDALEFLLKKL
jgi:uncharacterized protein